jgi:hypothetical protein
MLIPTDDCCLQVKQDVSMTCAMYVKAKIYSKVDENRSMIKTKSNHDLEATEDHTVHKRF